MNKEDILLLTDKGLAVFKYYIPFSFKLGRNFLNPLYKDSKASCNVYFDRRNGMYKMKDFGNDDYSGDCFALVGKLNGLNCKEPKDFVEILAIIDRDMHRETSPLKQAEDAVLLDSSDLDIDGVVEEMKKIIKKAE